ncbi:NUDIX hydrolase domain-like protein [Mycena galericulata]|nr:NUDIX hydrolase domain-like protein [Mycena galericulata]
MTQAFAHLSRPLWNSALFKPFTLKTLRTIRASLLQNSSRFERPPGLASLDKKQSAAILIPFCNVKEVPGILLQVRSRSMRSHSGEVSCPGGKVDELSDSSLLDCALRETYEETGISRARIEILGSIGPPEKSLRGDTVWPFVGFVHASESMDRSDINEDEPLPSIDLPAIEHTASKDEVAAIFHLPLAELANSSRLIPHLFRDERPYWAVDVSDLVSAKEGEVPFNSGSIEASQEDEVGAGREGRIEVWGLTGWFLFLVSQQILGAAKAQL